VIDLRVLAIALGGETLHGYVMAPGPGHSLRDRSLKVWVDGDRKLACCSFAGDPWSLCIDYVRAKLGRSVSQVMTLKDGRNPMECLTDAMHRWHKDAADYRAGGNYAAHVWNSAVDPGGTPVADYLSRRKLELDEGMAGRLVRYLEHCPRGAQRVPAMLVRFSRIANPLTELALEEDLPVQCVQRVFLDPAQNKGHSGRSLLGHPFSLPMPLLREGRVCLPPKQPVLAMKPSPDHAVEVGVHLSEGLETGLAAMMAGFKPLWAVYSAQAMTLFPVLPGIEVITLMADKDESGAGERAAFACKRRWEAAGRQARVVIPNTIGDWADAWAARR